MHLEYHKAEAFNCECGIIFNTKLHKVHHMQVRFLYSGAATLEFMHVYTFFRVILEIYLESYSKLSSSKDLKKFI